jgi:hypothetical protein
MTINGLPDSPLDPPLLMHASHPRARCCLRFTNHDSDPQSMLPAAAVRRDRAAPKPNNAIIPTSVEYRTPAIAAPSL